MKRNRYKCYKCSTILNLNTLDNAPSTLKCECGGLMAKLSDKAIIVNHEEFQTSISKFINVPQ